MRFDQENEQLLYMSAASVKLAMTGRSAEFIRKVGRAYRLLHAGDAALPKSEYLRYDGRPSYDRIIALLGFLGGEFSIAGLKQICSSTGNATIGLPRASGLIILNDVVTSRPFAILEAATISAARTSAVTGLAIDLFTARLHRTIALIGCGELGIAHLKMISEVFGDRSFEIVAYDHEKLRLHAALEMAQSLGLSCEGVLDAETAIRRAQIIIPATTSETPYIRAEWLQPHSLYCAVSLLDAELDVYTSADHVFVDDLRTCLAEGRPLERLLQQGLLPTDRITAIGEIADQQAAKAYNEGRIVFNPMGTIITDLVVALDVLSIGLEQGLCVRLPR